MASEYTTKKFAEITQKVISLMERDLRGEYEKGWISVLDFRPAVNPVTGTTYRGVNNLILAIEQEDKGYTSNCWMTFKQISAKGGKVIKGSKSTDVVFYDFSMYLDKKRITLETYKGLSKARKQEVKQARVTKFYKVFNVEQTEDLPEEFVKVPEAVTLSPVGFCPAADALVSATGVELSHKGNRAYYSPIHDHVVMPQRDQFVNMEEYYSTLFHELTHWTGHDSRCDRDLMNGSFGSPEYAFEELIAELGGAFLSASVGLTPCAVNRAAYIQSWLKALNNDKQLIFKAAGKAQKAVDFVLGFSNAAAKAA